MTDEKAYETLQDLLALAEELKNSGHYSAEEILDEVRTRIGE